MFGECHVHIALNGISYQASIAQHKPAVNEAALRQTFASYRACGISFIRDGGDAQGVSATAKLIAPEYDIAYRSPLFAIHKYGHYGRIVGRSFDTLREYAALVQEADRQGADFIKIMTTGIMDFNHYGVITGGEALSGAEVREMVHIAHEHGLAIMSHTNGAKPVLDALEAGVDSIEHGNYLNDEAIQALAESPTAFVPTATVVRNLIGSGLFNDDVLTQIRHDACETISRAFDAGALLALGSDAGAGGVLHGQGTQDEYTCLKESVPDIDALDARLAAGETFIRNTFKRPDQPSPALA